MIRSRTVAFWATPPLASLILYWPGLTCWFQKDDFAWLGLRDMVHSWHDFWWALFAPLAQGTIRTLSERVFYMSFSAVFGLNPLPYRCWAFLVHAATLTVLSSVCTKLTGSRAAGFWAAIFYTVNSALAIALSWTAISYELLCSFCFLFCLWLLIRYVETGERRFYLWQCAVFLLGFGVLELNVVYPALALTYALCRARHIIHRVVPLFVPSAVYTAIHFAVAPFQPSGPYQMFWDAKVFSTLWIYWKMALGFSRLNLLGIYPSPGRSLVTGLLTASLIGFLIWKLRRREWIAAFFPAWFLIVLAPLLPLRNHIEDDYLTIPLIGLATWGAWALVSGWRAGRAARVAAVALASIYVCAAVPLGRVNSMSFYTRSQEIRSLVLGVVSESRKDPGRTILLEGLEPDMFWSAVYDRPFRLFGVSGVYVSAEDRQRIAPGPQPESVRQFFMDRDDQAIVLDVRGGRVTRR